MPRRYQDGGLVQSDRLEEILERARQRRAQLQGEEEEFGFTPPPLPDEVTGAGGDIVSGALEGAGVAAAALPAFAEVARRTVDPKRAQIEEALREGAAKIRGRVTASPRARRPGIRGATAQILQEGLEGMVRNPKSAAAVEIAAGAGAGAAMEVAESAGVGEAGQALSGLMGGIGAGVAPGATISMLQRAARWGLDNLVAPFGRAVFLGKPAEAVAKNRVARRLQGLAEDPSEAAALAMEGIEGVTPARRTGDRRLMGLEARILEDNPEFDRAVRRDLEEAAQRAQGELADLYATTAGRRDWRQAIFQRVAAPGAPEIPAGETADMLEQTYQSYKPAYEVIKGYPVMPRLFGRRSTSLETMLENVPKLNRVDAGDDTRKRVADGLRNAYSAFRRNLRTGENGEKLAGSEHYLRLRSRIRDLAREARRQGDRDRAALYDIAADRVTDVLSGQLPDEALNHLRRVDQQYRHYKTIEDAVFRAGDRPFGPDHVLSAIRMGAPSRGQYARGRAQPQLRALAQSGRPISQWINKPEVARQVSQSLPKEEKEALKYEFVQELMRRSMRTDEEGIERVSGPRLQSELNKLQDTAKSIGMSDSEIDRLRRIAREIRIVQQKSPAAIAQVFEDGPSHLMELLATLIGVREGHRLGKGTGASQMVLSGFLAKRARAALGVLTRDLAEEIMIEAHRNPELYSALLTRVTDPVADQRRAARILNAYLPYVASETALDTGLEELREESESLLGDLALAGE